ncbi:Uncharacterized protein GBIM_08180 [Gryllus bimaculatus]|nr:Uncharacterized protein GBIM_08180 [Gryllus bimaculatus]
MEESHNEEKNGNVPEKLTRICGVNDGIDAPKWKFWKRRRYILTAMTFLGFFNMLALRSNVSVAVTAMTTKRTVDLENGTSEEEPEFKWDSKMQGLVLGSYFYGYITTQIFGGWLGAKIGGNILFGAGIAGTSALTLLTPILVKMNVYCFVGLRVLEGAFEGISFPSIQDVWAHWIPRQERNRLATISYSGRYIGTFVCMTVSGILAEHLGWPYVFYLFGFLGLLWYSMWLLLIRRRPQDDKSINLSELNYIRKNIEETQSQEETIRYPWKTFLLSGPVWAITVANVTDNWGAFTLLTQLPTFLKDSLEFDVQDAGILSSLPYLAVAFTMQISGLCADYILVKKYLTTTQVRKLFCCSAFLCQAIFMLLTAFLQTPAAAVTFLTLSVGFGAFATAAYTYVFHVIT